MQVSLPCCLSTSSSQKSLRNLTRASLGLLIPPDPQNTWCYHELVSILFQLWVCAKALKPKINCPQARGQQEVLEMWTGQEVHLRVTPSPSRSVTSLFSQPVRARDNISQPVSSQTPPLWGHWTWRQDTGFQVRLSQSFIVF